MYAKPQDYLTKKQIVTALREIAACAGPVQRRALIARLRASNAPDVIRALLATEAHKKQEAGMSAMQLDCTKPAVKEYLTSGHVVTMSSREIAVACNKRHQHVRRDIEKMLSDLKIDVSRFGHIYLDLKNREQKEYRLPKDLTMTLITGYRADLRYAVIKRLEALESGAMALPDFGNPILAARAWADQLERADGAEQALQAAAPALVAHEVLIEAEGSLCITDAAKALQMRPKELFAWLRKHRWIFRRNGGVWLGYSAMLIAGFLEHKVTTISRSSGVAKVAEQVRVTPKGLAKLAYVLDLEDKA